MKKELRSEPFKNTRDLVNFVNENSIQKDDIVTILLKNDQLFLIYYTN